MNKQKGYRDLQVYSLAKSLAIEVHKMSMSLPKHEMYEEGSQIRRSSKSVVSCIVEGFARRSYKNDFLHYITVALAECDETQVHLELLFETGSLKNKDLFSHLVDQYRQLARMLNSFKSSVAKHHISER